MCERIHKKIGIKLAPKDLRDYFATMVSGQRADTNTLMHLMRHTSLTTTTKYMRTLHESRKDALANLGADLGGGFEASTGMKHRKTT